MKAIPSSLKNLIEQFAKLPGIGKKTAERLSIYILKNNKDDALLFSEAIIQLKKSINTCDVCHSFIDGKCAICEDLNRNKDIICVVKDPIDIFVIEKSGYKGLYHVLNGLISPLDGITPETLNIESLIDRISDVKEVVLGIEPSSEGDITNLYLSKLLKDKNIKVTRFARGMPIGSSLEFLDELTLAHSIEDRVEIK